MFSLVFTDTFHTRYLLLVNTQSKKKKAIKALQLLAQDPRHPSLHSHKVMTRQFGEKWSSTLTGDLRIIWEYDQDEVLSILVLTLGSHTGKHKIYQ